MPEEQKIIDARRILPAVGGFILANAVAYGIYRVLLYSLEKFFPAQEEVNKDFLLLLMGVLEVIIVAFTGHYLYTGKWLIRWQKTAPSPQPQVAQVAETPPARRVGLGVAANITWLTIIWAGAAYYCQLLYSAIYETLIDTKLIDLAAPTAERLLTTIRGAFFLGTFFPVAIGGTFLCGFIAGQRLSYRALIIPPLIMYGILNVSSTVRTGYPSAFPVFLREALGQTQSLYAGKVVVIWFVAAAIFMVIVALLALLAKVFANMGHRLRVRLQ